MPEAGRDPRHDELNHETGSTFRIPVLTPSGTLRSSKSGYWDAHLDVLTVDVLMRNGYPRSFESVYTLLKSKPHIMFSNWIHNLLVALDPAHLA